MASTASPEEGCEKRARKERPGPLFSGVIPALVTPFTVDGRAVNLEVIPALVKLHLDAGVGGFYLCGNTGEGFACTTAERKAVVEAVVAAAAGAKPILVHVGACPVDEAVELAKHAKESGAQGVSSVVPPDKPNSMAAAVEYFTRVGAATDLPFYVYWVAKDADCSMDAERYLRAMRDVPNFAGVKFTDTNFYLFQQLHYLAPRILGRRLNALTGPDEMALAGLAMGADGAIGSTYNLQPRLNVALHEAWRAGDVRMAMELQERLNAVIAKLLAVCDCRSRVSGIVAGIKAVYRARGLPVGPPRPAAAVDLAPEAADELVAFLGGLDWEVE